MNSLEDLSLESATWRLLLPIITVGWVLSAWLVYSLPYVPIQDYPNHLLRQHISQNIDKEPYSSYITVDTGFRPNLAMDLVLDVLTPNRELHSAGKVLLAVELLVIQLGATVFIGRFGPSAAAALLAIQLSTSWVFLKGFVNFGFGVGFGLIWLAILWGRARIGPLRWAVAAGLGIATAVSHAFAFLAFSFLILAGHLFDNRVLTTSSMARVLSSVPGLMLFLGFVLGTGRGSGVFENRFIYSSDLKDLLFWNPLIIWSRARGRLDEYLGAFCWAILLVGLLIVLYRYRPIGPRDASCSLRTLWGFLAGSMFLYFLLPDDLSGDWTAYMKYRICLILFFAGLPIFFWTNRRFRAIASAVALTAATAGLVVSYVTYREFSNSVSAYMEVTEEMPEQAVILSLNLNDNFGRNLYPYQHIWSYACIEKDCLSQELFADEYIQNIYFSRPLPGRREVRPPYEISSIVSALESGQYDAVLIAGQLPNSMSDSLRQWKVVAFNRDGTLMLKR